jgi:CDP-glycerol glycerophosphotransferase
MVQPPAGHRAAPTAFGLRRWLRRVALIGAYAAARFSRRDRNRWVIGNLKGFRDDSRYLAEHLAVAHPEIETWWIARSDAEAAAARAAGLRAAVRGDRPATDAQRHAGVAFVANGFDDLQPAHLGGAFVVDLRHGQGLKKVLLDMLPLPDRRLPLGRRLRVAARRWWIRRRLGQVDLVVAPGAWAKARFATAFGCPPSRIQVLGMPRFDVLQGGPALTRIAGADHRASLGIGPEQYLVVWLPTWREAGDAAWLPVLEHADVERAAARRDLVILVKPHPFSDLALYRQRLTDSSRVRLLTEGDSDVNALLHEADALVTDYSSAAFDYAILDRPIYFLTPDLAAFTAGHALYEPIETLSDGHQHATWSTLLPVIAADEEQQGLAATRRIRELSQTRSAPGSSERIVEAAGREVGLGQAGSATVPER